MSRDVARPAETFANGPHEADAAGSQGLPNQMGGGFRHDGVTNSCRLHRPGGADPVPG